MVIHHDAIQGKCKKQIDNYMTCKGDTTNLIRNYMPQCVPKAKDV